MRKGCKFIRVLVAIWFMTLSINTIEAKEPEMEFARTAQPGEFLKQKLEAGEFGSRTLIILDLDDTTITTPEGQWLGRSEMFYHLVKAEGARFPDKTRQEVVDEIDPLLSLVYKKVPIQLTDSTLPEVFEQLNRKGVTVIGMTARGFPVADATNAQLKQAGVMFSDTGPVRMIAIDKERSFRVEHGVVMVGQGNKKGEALVALLEQEVLSMPDRVMLVDDHQRHLDSVRDSLNSYKTDIAYMPVLCTFLDGRKSFDPVESEQQLLSFLYQWRHDSQIEAFVKQDVFSQRFIARCKTMGQTENPHCLPLQKYFDIRSTH